MKVAELQGAELDYWVAKAERFEAEIFRGYCFARSGLEPGKPNWTPSTDWKQAGPIIEREQIWLFWNGNGTCTASVREHVSAFDGPTPLVAAMRAYVASKFGDEVSQPQG